MYQLSRASCEETTAVKRTASSSMGREPLKLCIGGPELSAVPGSREDISTILSDIAATCCLALQNTIGLQERLHHPRASHRTGEST